MDFKIFDTYNIRSKLSVYIIIVSPFLISLYVLYEPIRSFSFSTLFLIILFAFSNYLFTLQMYFQKKISYQNTAAELLYFSDTRIDSHTKKRYYQKLCSIDCTFESPSESNEFHQACTSAIKWLRNNTRDNKLIQENNILYGFYRNLLSFKVIGITFLLLSIVIQLIFLPTHNLLALLTAKKTLLLILFDILYLLFWLIGVNDKIRQVVADKYARSLLGSIDNIS